MRPWTHGRTVSDVSGKTVSSVGMRCSPLVRAFSTPPRGLGVKPRGRPLFPPFKTRHNFAVEILAGAISPAPEVRLTKTQNQSIVLDVFYLPVFGRS